MTNTTDLLKGMLTKQEYFRNVYRYTPRLKDIAMAIAAEAMELWEGSGGKWWKSYEDGNGEFLERWGKLTVNEAETVLKQIELINEEHNKEEIIDLLHFVLEACLQYGMSAEEIYNIYSQKMVKNRERQRTGY